jgi:hypothetical protein
MKLELLLTASLGCLAAFTLGGSSFAQIPDVIVYDVGVNGGDTNDIFYYGQSGGIAAYSIATQSCNSGTAPVDWFDGGGDTRHPVISQNMFRWKDGRFEQIGQSWLKHGFCAVNEVESQCAPCQNTNCDTLGVGCADTYWATLNDGGSGRSKRWVNATAGTHVDGTTGPTGVSTIRGRLQVQVTDIDPAQNPGAEYYIEGHYVTADDADAGTATNNASWRRVNVVAVNNVDGDGPTNRTEPAIFAWKDADPDVLLKSVVSIENDGKSTFYIGSRVTQVGPFLWNYEYAIQNLNSDQSGGSFSVPVNSLVTVTNIGFHDVDYHSGDPYDGTDWPGVQQGGEVRWATTDFNTNPDANALRWGTLYNFRFDANTPPVLGPVTLGLFKPGPTTDVAAPDMWVPMDAPNPPIGSGGPTNVATQGPPTPGPTATVPITRVRGGHHVNPTSFSETEPAYIGEEWQGAVELGDAPRSLLLIGSGGPSDGVRTAMGELLVRPPLATRVGTQRHTIAIPADPRLVGATLYLQAATLQPTGWQLTNALDVTIGTRP